MSMNLQADVYGGPDTCVASYNAILARPCTTANITTFATTANITTIGTTANITTIATMPKGTM